MNRLAMVFLVALGSTLLTSIASADFNDMEVPDPTRPVLVNPGTLRELRASQARLATSSHAHNDTTWVGYNPAYAGSNYWSIGVGHRRPPGNTAPIDDDDTGYWDWEHPVHGDTLQGWWPVRQIYTNFLPASPDHDRLWTAIDIGNTISNVVSQGPGLRRTYGVTSAWHVDPGVNGKVADPSQSDVNPKPPRWTPLAGGMSAWCGLRAHGDLTAIDALTGNPYNVDALGWVQRGLRTDFIQPPSGTGHRYPGYAGQWDQMLYRDIDISDTTVALSGANVSVSFRFRTRMSTGKNTTPSLQTGWFDKDPLAVVAGNFISAWNAGPTSPIDSFMVYVGCPVADTVGAEWTGSDGLTHQVFDPVRRWFGELIRANEAGGHYELFTTYGDRPPIVTPADSNGVVVQTATRNVTYGQLRAAWGNRIRLVFRVKTNRGNETFSDDNKGSFAGAYTSGYRGAAQVDDVAIDLGGGTAALGGFESESEIDNHPEASPLACWKTSSKSPAVTFHVHDLSSLTYEDLCGPPTSKNRMCDMAGGVVSMGGHDLAEAATGPFDTAEHEHYQGIFSPTINLAFDPGNPTSKNNMGLDADSAVPTYGFATAFNLYTGWFDLISTGQGWQVVYQSYPAAQSDGTRMWGDVQWPATGPLFNPDKHCFDMFWLGSDWDQIKTINANGVPDSIRIGFIKTSQCHRFGLTTTCGGTAGGYLDNISLAIIDGATTPISVMPWDFWQDTFPANETAGLPGSAAFDTTTALIKGGLNTDYGTGAYTDPTRYDVPQDTLRVYAPGDSVEVQLVFRILPGPGNYVVAGDPCSGLRLVPNDTTRITPGDGSFWTAYILNPGRGKDGFPITGACNGGGPLRHDQRWSERVWCSARMDTAEANLFPVRRRSLGGPAPGTYATMYHEDDKHLAALGLPRHKCFLTDTLGAVNMTNITCSSVPAWASAAQGYDGNAYTVEGTKILPDGLLTPGSHVQYFFEKKDLAAGTLVLCPDTNVVYPQAGEQNLDGHRWQQFSVLPDAWKFASYGGVGRACMLYVDGNDGNGTERAWVSVADSIGATHASRRGAHNGWSAPGGTDLNDPAWFVNQNAQPGTTWDLYGVKAAAAGDAPAGTLGARLAYRGLGTLLTDKWAKNAPTPEMLAAYYRVLMILTGGAAYQLMGPFPRRTSDDTEVVRQFVTGAAAGAHRGLFVQGAGFVEDLDAYYNTTLQGIIGASLREPSYAQFSGNGAYCIDLLPGPAITTNGDIYGLRNPCSGFSDPDVLTPAGGAQAASYYDPVGANPLNAPYVAGVFSDADPDANRHYQTLVDAWDTANVMSRLCATSSGRLAYFWNVFHNVFGKICAVAGTGPMTTEVPNNREGRTFVDLAGIGNNPLRSGSAVIHLTLAKADRVTVKIYDVSGRLVRTLADGQLFQAGRVDPALTWDGLDDGGRRATRGVYFANVRYERSRYEVARKMIVLK